MGIQRSSRDALSSGAAPVGVECSNAWLHPQTRLRVRDEPRDEVHFGFLVLSGCLIFFRNLKPSFC
ncbi:isjp4 transposase [Stigmatella aurantiaca DW4/3-1]|uniref:Isjp4 transposase n=1 Tax=Stigmatella aurantiaca (strain DW4/3-1) TaxID=378806 RepID=Q099A5_STIAD|nr:isjp4 transposase [Stigmatella aurantiaca DW4/3-1]